MGCRPSKQARSKIRALEHKNDVMCLCSPKRLRKGQGHHKCCQAADPSPVECCRASGAGTAASAAGGKHNHKHHHHHHGHHHNRHRQHGDTDTEDGAADTFTNHHCYSTGHRPGSSRSAHDATDFPAFSTTTAVYRRSASKTSRITLRLSCDGSTLEIEQCDYDLDRPPGSSNSNRPRPWSSAPNLTKALDITGSLFMQQRGYVPLMDKDSRSPSSGCGAGGSGVLSALPGSGCSSGRSSNISSSRKGGTTLHRVPVEVNAHAMMDGGCMQGNSSCRADSSNYSHQYDMPQKFRMRESKSYSACSSTRPWSYSFANEKGGQSDWVSEASCGVTSADSHASFSSAKSTTQSQQQVTNSKSRHIPSSTTGASVCATELDGQIDSMIDRLESSLANPNHITDISGAGEKSYQEADPQTARVEKLAVNQVFSAARPTTIDTGCVNSNVCVLPVTYPLTTNNQTCPIWSEQINLRPGYPSTYTDISPDFECIPVNIISSLIKPLPEDPLCAPMLGTEVLGKTSVIDSISSDYMNTSIKDSDISHTTSITSDPKGILDSASDDYGSDVDCNILSIDSSGQLCVTQFARMSDECRLLDATQRSEVAFQDGFNFEHRQTHLAPEARQYTPSNDFHRLFSDRVSLSPESEPESLQVMLALGCPLAVPGESRSSTSSFLYSGEDKSPLSFFTPEHHSMCPLSDSSDPMDSIVYQTSIQDLDQQSHDLNIERNLRHVGDVSNEIPCSETNHENKSYKEPKGSIHQDVQQRAEDRETKEQLKESIDMVIYHQPKHENDGSSLETPFCKTNLQPDSETAAVTEVVNSLMGNMVIEADINGNLQRPVSNAINENRLQFEEDDTSDQGLSSGNYEKIIANLESDGYETKDDSQGESRAVLLGEESVKDITNYSDNDKIKSVKQLATETDNSRPSQDVGIVTPDLGDKHDFVDCTRAKSKEKKLPVKAKRKKRSDLPKIRTDITTSNNLGDTSANFESNTFRDKPSARSKIGDSRDVENFAVSSRDPLRDQGQVVMGPIVTYSGPGAWCSQESMEGKHDTADYLVELLRQDTRSLSPSPRYDRHTRFCYDFDFLKANEPDMVSVSDASDYEISPLFYKKLGDPFLAEDLDIFTSMYGVRKAIVARNIEMSMQHFHKDSVITGKLSDSNSDCQENLQPCNMQTKNNESSKQRHSQRNVTDSTRTNEKRELKYEDEKQRQRVWNERTLPSLPDDTLTQANDEEESVHPLDTPSSSSSNRSSISTSSQGDTCNSSFYSAESSSSSSPSYASSNFVLFRPSIKEELRSDRPIYSGPADKYKPKASPQDLVSLQALVLNKNLNLSCVDDTNREGVLVNSLEREVDNFENKEANNGNPPCLAKSKMIECLQFENDAVVRMISGDNENGGEICEKRDSEKQILYEEDFNSKGAIAERPKENLSGQNNSKFVTGTEKLLDLEKSYQNGAAMQKLQHDKDLSPITGNKVGISSPSELVPGTERTFFVGSCTVDNEVSLPPFLSACTVDNEVSLPPFLSVVGSCTVDNEVSLPPFLSEENEGTSQCQDHDGSRFDSHQWNGSCPRNLRKEPYLDLASSDLKNARSSLDSYPINDIQTSDIQSQSAESNNQISPMVYSTDHSQHGHDENVSVCKENSSLSKKPEENYRRPHEEDLVSGPGRLCNDNGLHDLPHEIESVDDHDRQQQNIPSVCGSSNNSNTTTTDKSVRCDIRERSGGDKERETFTVEKTNNLNNSIDVSQNYANTGQQSLQSDSDDYLERSISPVEGESVGNSAAFNSVKVENPSDITRGVNQRLKPEGSLPRSDNALKSIDKSSLSKDSEKKVNSSEKEQENHLHDNEVSMEKGQSRSGIFFSPAIKPENNSRDSEERRSLRSRELPFVNRVSANSNPITSVVASPRARLDLPTPAGGAHHTSSQSEANLRAPNPSLSSNERPSRVTRNGRGRGSAVGGTWPMGRQSKVLSLVNYFEKGLEERKQCKQ